jgi:hypothetical protein
MAWWHSQPEGSTMQGNTTTCPDCGHTVSKGNLARHRRAQHSTNPGRTPQGIVAAIANTTETPPVEPPVETPEAPVPATPADLQAELDKLAPELEKYAAGYKAYKKARVAKKGAAGDELAKAEATMEKHHKAFTAYCRAAARKRSLLKAMPGGN